MLRPSLHPGPCSGRCRSKTASRSEAGLEEATDPGARRRPTARSSSPGRTPIRLLWCNSGVRVARRPRARRGGRGVRRVCTAPEFDPEAPDRPRGAATERSRADPASPVLHPLLLDPRGPRRGGARGKARRPRSRARGREVGTGSNRRPCAAPALQPTSTGRPLAAPMLSKEVSLHIRRVPRAPQCAVWVGHRRWRERSVGAAGPSPPARTRYPTRPASLSAQRDARLRLECRRDRSGGRGSSAPTARAAGGPFRSNCGGGQRKDVEEVRSRILACEGCGSKDAAL